MLQKDATMAKKQNAETTLETMDEEQGHSFRWFVGFSIITIATVSPVIGWLCSIAINKSVTSCMIGVAIFLFLICSIVAIWEYAIVPLSDKMLRPWWHKHSRAKRDKMQTWITGIVLVVLVYTFGGPVLGGHSGEGQVDMFPQGSTSKHYILTATIKTTPKLWFQYDYEVQTITWPDGETDSFRGCVVHGSGVSTCTTVNSEQTYRVSIEYAPDASEGDNG